MLKSLKLLKSLPIQLCIAIILALFFGKIVSVSTVSLFYTVSCLFIEILLFCLPLVIFSFISRALLNLARGSLALLLLIFVGVTVSNCLALTVAYSVGSVALPFVGIVPSLDFAANFRSSVQVLFSFNLPTVIGMETALLAGVLCGLAISFVNDDNPAKQKIKSFLIMLSDKISLCLSKIFIPLLPFYVFGFCLKLSYDNALINLFYHYGVVFVLSFTLVVMYIFTLYFIGAKANMRATMANIKNMIPAGLTAFSTMSSAATMPVTLNCTEKNTGDRNFTDLIIPSTANIHMLGDDITIVMMAMALSVVFGVPWPDVVAFIPFALAFSMAKLSCVGIPGASVLVILPVLQSYLGFSAEMISVVTTIYILQDSFGTAANVMGNGAFAIIIKRIFAVIRPKAAIESRVLS